MGRAWPGGAPVTAGCCRRAEGSRASMPEIRASGQAQRAAKLPPRLGRCEGAPASALARHRREHREPFHAGGERRATWKWQGGWSGRTAADSRRRCARWKGNWSGRFARRREQGEGVSRSRTRRGASEARRGRGDFARSAQTSPDRRTPLRQDGGRSEGAGPKGSPTRRAPWKLRSQRWRRGRAQRGRWVAPAAAPGGTPPGSILRRGAT